MLIINNDKYIFQSKNMIKIKKRKEMIILLTVLNHF